VSTSDFPEGAERAVVQPRQAGGLMEGGGATPAVTLAAGIENKTMVPAVTEGPIEGGGTTPVMTPDQQITAMFQTDQLARAAVTKNMTQRTGLTQAAALRAQQAFANFDLSRHSPQTRDQASYLASGASSDKLTDAMKTTMSDGLDKMQESSGSLRVSMTPKASSALQLDVKNGQTTMTAAAFLEYVKDMEIAKAKDPYTQCQVETEAQRRLAQITGTPPPPPPPPPAVNGNSPAVGNGVPTTVAEGGVTRAAALVDTEVGRQMATVTSPETALAYAVPQRSDQDSRRQALNSFELRDGPSDVVSYHDFSTLKIAFQHVWTELFDKQIKDLGAELYAHYVHLKDFSGNTAADLPISSTADITALLREVRALSEATVTNTPVDSSNANVPQVVQMLMQAIFGQPPAADKADAKSTAQGDDVLGTGSRLQKLLIKLESLLAEKYAFDVFYPNSVNFGFIVTYRQTWVPENYQVGELVSTIPLAPRETRRYTTRRVTKKTRAVKELEDNLTTRRNEQDDTSRVEREIVESAKTKSNFTMTAAESFGGEGYDIKSTQDVGGSQEKESARTKKDFREHVLKSAQEYKQQHRMEIETTESSETEETTFHELQNPNDELTVTYMFYELQRTFRISERIHDLTPVILVANDVPAPHEIDDAWLMQRDWILRRVILDDSFRPALRYLSESFVAAELNIRLLEANAAAQKTLVETLRQQVQAQDAVLSADEKAILSSLQNVGAAQAGQGLVDTVKGFFDPLHITHDIDTGVVDAAQAMADYAKETRDRAERERARLAAELSVATTALQGAIDKLGAAVREHYNKVAEIDRLRIHVKENILYYMQAIWSHEPPDQRYFRLYNVDVPYITIDTTNAAAHAKANGDAVTVMIGDSAYIKLPMASAMFPPKKLVEVADLDTVLGYKGNYTIFPLLANNYLTLHMMQDYLELGDELVVRDPDTVGEHSLDDLQALATCLYNRDKDSFTKHADEIKQLLIERLTSSRMDDDRVIVPTTSLYIEALVGTHPLLEDFKLIHRALDVKKVQAEVRHAELENIRLAARALTGNEEDPDIDRKIVVEGIPAQLALQPDGT
jgi:hypothetical protein